MYKKIFAFIIFALLITCLIIDYKNDLFIKEKSINGFCQQCKYKHLEKKGLYSDKIKVKKYIKENFPEIKFAKILYSGVKLDDLKNIKLPDNFVFKSSAGSRMFRLIKDGKYNINNLIKLGEHFLSINFYNYGYRKIPFLGLEEPHYKYNEPKILIEEHLGDVLEFRAFVIKGNIIYYECDGKRYNKEWKEMNITKREDYKFLEKNFFTKPINLHVVDNFINKFYEQNLIEFMRVDFYLKGEEFYFGELTFTPDNCRWGYNKNFDKEIYKKYIKNI